MEKLFLLSKFRAKMEDIELDEDVYYQEGAHPEKTKLSDSVVLCHTEGKDARGESYI